MNKLFLVASSVFLMSSPSYSMIDELKDQIQSGSSSFAPCKDFGSKNVTQGKVDQEEKENDDPLIEKLNKIYEKRPELAGCPFSYDKETGKITFAR